MKKSTLLFTSFFCFSAISALGQSAAEQAKKRMIDSIKAATLDNYAIRYPMLRQGAFNVDIIGNRTVKGELNGNKLFEGKTNISRIRSNFNLPLARWGKNQVTGTITYQQIHFDLKDVKSYQPDFEPTDRSITKASVGFTATFSRSDTLFGKQVNYAGSISGITDEFSSVRRVNYLGSISIPVSRSANSSLTAGIVVVIDPSAVIPVIPIISYWHKYQESGLDLYIDMPSRIALRKQLSKKSWVTMGSELGGNLYFFDLNKPPLPQNSIYATVDIRTGATLEYLVTKKLIVGVSGGLYALVRSTMFDHKNKPDDYFFKTNTGAVPYVGFSMSFLPFIKR